MKSILVIDDDHSYCTFLKKMLEKIGYEVKALRSPEAAFAETECHARYSHLLIDFEFRGSQLTGEDVGHRLRWKWPLLPTVLITAYMQQENARKRYLSVGWDGSFEKNAPGVVATDLSHRLDETLNDAVRKCEIRIKREYPISDGECLELVKRLDALEKAYRHKAGKEGAFSEREVTQAACIFLSTGQDKLTERDVELLRAFRGNRMRDLGVWEGSDIKMTSQNNWSAFFRVRENPKQKNETNCGRLLINGLRVRHLILQNRGRWPLTCSQYGPAIEVVKEFGLTKWAQGNLQG